MQLNVNAETINELGYELVAISYDDTDVLASFAKRRDISFTLLSDPNSATIDDYGLRDPQYDADSMAFGVPKPIIIIVGADGMVQSKLYEESYQLRPPVELIIESIQEVHMPHE